MNTQRKLTIDASSLWDEPLDQFVLRFNDLNESKQIHFAERLKKSAPQFRLRNNLGPNKEEISDFLKEINPIIFAEGRLRINNYSEIVSYEQRRWNTYSVYSLSGWCHKRLCKIVYRFLCVARQPEEYDITNALRVSTDTINNIGVSLNTRIANLINTISNEQNENFQSPEEIGINEVRQARETTERRNRIPVNY